MMYLMHIDVFVTVRFYLSFCLSIYLSVCMPVYLSVSLSIYLSISTSDIIMTRYIICSNCLLEWHDYLDHGPRHNPTPLALPEWCPPGGWRFYAFLFPLLCVTFTSPDPVSHDYKITSLYIAVSFGYEGELIMSWVWLDLDLIKSWTPPVGSQQCLIRSLTQRIIPVELRFSAVSAGSDPWGWGQLRTENDRAWYGRKVQQDRKCFLHVVVVLLLSICRSVCTVHYHTTYTNLSAVMYCTELLNRSL